MTGAIIHMFWHGPPLSDLERLCMASFVYHGHELRLYSYEPLERVPAGVTEMDAASVLPASEIFLTRRKKSLAHFADYFRAVVLHRYGGIWADTDVVCLQPLNYASPFILGYEDGERINNAVMGLPAGHQLTQELLKSWDNPCRILPFDDGRSKRRKWLRRLLPGDPKTRLKWGELGPVGVTQWIRYWQLEDQILPFWHFYPVPHSHWRSIFDGSLVGNLEFLGNARCLHLWNEMLRRHGIDKNQRFVPNSLIETLRQRYLPDDG